MSRLEKFIEQNRDDFDDQLPPGNVWDNIEAAVIKKEKQRSVITPFYRWGIAASILLVITASVFLVMNKNKPASVEVAVKNDPVDSTVFKAAPDEAPQMVQFTRLIETKQEELRIMAKEQPELYKKFASDINQLDSSYNTLKTRLSETPNKEMLIEAMIQNLQLQLQVLNQQLNIINQIKNSKSNSNEKNNQFI